MYKDLIFFGIQGCGKGTQAKLVMDYYGEKYSYLSTGETFRALSVGDNAISEYMNKRLEKGKLVNDDVTIAVFDLYFYITVDSNKAMLLDGYPRSQRQIDELFDLVKEQDRKVLGIYFDLSDEKAIERMINRGRSDDTPESIERRLKSYHEKTKPIIDHFGTRGDIVKINADQSVEKIFQDLKAIIDEGNEELIVN